MGSGPRGKQETGGGLRMVGVAFLEKQLLPTGQLGGQSGRKRLRLKRSGLVLINIPNKAPGFM